MIRVRSRRCRVRELHAVLPGVSRHFGVRRGFRGSQGSQKVLAGSHAGCQGCGGFSGSDGSGLSDGRSGAFGGLRGLGVPAVLEVLAADRCRGSLGFWGRKTPGAARRSVVWCHISRLWRVEGELSDLRKRHGSEEINH